MAEEEKTYKDASKLQGGTPSAQYKAGSNIGGLDIITPYGNIISGSLKDNNAIETTPSDMQSARIGDYYLTSKGIAKLVPNSETDIDRKLRAIYGASPKQSLKPTDYANAGLTAGAAFLGLPTDQSNLASTAGTFLVGKAAGGHPLTKTVWTIYSFFKSLNDAENRYLDDFSNQMVDIKPAYHIEERDGQRYAIIDEDAAASAGYGSGSLLTDITDYDKNKERTNVTLENGMLNISASSLYLNSDRYANLIDTIKSAYPDGITEEEASRVTDEDGESKTMLERIKDYVVDDEAQFYYKAKSIKMFKQLAPDASNLALNEACDTQTIGYMDTKTLEGTDVTIYDSDNNKKEVNALEYLRTIRDMSDEERNNYMAELGNRVLSDDISDDEKVVLRAQANALYAASSQESGEFKDMYKKDFGDSIADVSLPVIGRIGNWYGADELETFETNEFYASGLTLAAGIPNLYVMKKIMGANEAGIRKGVSALGSKTGIGFLENINKFAPSNGHYVMNLVAGDLMNNIKELARRGLSDLSKFTIDAAADLGYDTMTAIAHGISGQEFNFKEEFWRDLYLDAIMTAGPQEFVKFAEMDKTTLKKIDGEVKFVKQSADELRAKRSKISTDLTASNAAISALRSFFDMNYALTRHAVRTAAFTKGDGVEQQKLIRLSADVEQVASGELSKFMVSNKEVAQHFMDYNKALSDVAPKPKNYTKADRNYINAAANQHRFEQMAKGDRSATIAVHKKYKEALNGVSKERAEQLDTLLNSMRTICGDLLDFYKERGLISKETYEAFKNHPAYKDNMFFPVWVKDKKYTAKDIVPQERKALKEVLDPKDLLDVDTFEDPLVTFSLYMNAVMRNVASNERKLAAIEAGLIAGMETRVTKDTGGHLAEYENLKKYSDQFKGKYDRIVREVKKEVPTLEEYKQDNEDAVQRSGAFKNIEQLKALQDEGRELRNRLRREQRALEKAQKGEFIETGVKQSGVEDREAARNEARIKLADDEKEFRYLNSELAKHTEQSDPKFIPTLSYADRKSLAQNFARENDGYIVLYRVQNGAPDQWRPNNRGVNGKFEAIGGEEALKGAVWLTADGEWAEGVDRASAGVGKEATDENIVAIPVKKSDILNLNTEIDSKAALDESGKKIVKTRGIDGGLKKSEYILWENEHPEIFEEGMEKMLEQHNKDVSNSAFHRKIARKLQDQLDERKILNDAHKEELKDAEAQTPVERAQADIDQTRQEIVMNKQEQMKVVNDLPRLTKNLMKRQQAKNVWSPVVLDVDSYLNIQFVNDVREALKQNNSYANLYTAISRAVTRANPYVSQEDVIDKRAGEEAVKFRKKLSKDLPGQGETKVDTILNKILEKFNVKPKVYDKDRGVVHYWMDGKIETVTFEGPGASFLAEALNAPDFAPPRTTTEMLREKGRGIGRKFARTKRTLTSAVDFVSALRNIPRDILRGTVTTGGQVLLSPKELETEAKGYWKDSPEAIEKIERGWRLTREAMKGSTFAQSLEVPKRNRAKSMIISAHSATAPNGFVRFIWDFKNKTIAGKASTLNDAAEHFTRYRVSDVTYYRTLAQESAKGATIDEAINAAMEASYFNGKEATTNFARRGAFIGRIAENVPYLSQKFSSIQSLYLEWVNNPIAFTRSLRSFIFAYSALITIALSNEESRKRYFLLTDYDRANNVIIPLDNGMIITIPLDENLAAFATAWRRGIETLNGVDPEAFYLWGAEFLAALSPLDFTGFSEGDKFNIERGFQKLGNEMLPTWVLPLLENAQGRNFYYGTNIKVDEEYTEQYYDNPNPTPGEMTTRSKNSKTLAALSNLTGIPQWKLQNLLETYGGTVGQYVLNGLDKVQGATVEEQGGREFKDAIFKPFTGADSNAARDALWEGVGRLNDEKAKLKKELKGIDNKIEASTGDEKAKLQEERQKKIEDYGTRVTDFVSQYMSAYEITGGLSKKDANRIWYLYDIHGDADNAGTYLDDSYESYLNNKIRKQKNKHTTNLAAGFGLDQFIDRSKWVSDYNDTYAKQAFENSIYGQGYQTMAKIAKVFEDTSDYNNSLAKLRNDAYEARKKAYAANNYDLADAIAYEYDYKILSAALPYLEDAGLEQSLNNSTVMDYLKDWIMVPSEEMKAANGRYLSRLPSETEKSEAFKKRFIKKMYGVLEDE